MTILPLETGDAETLQGSSDKHPDSGGITPRAIYRNDFPQEFVFGCATSAYQIEGGAFTDGKGNSSWDYTAHQPGAILTGENGDVACDSYHKYEEDVCLLANLGVDAYRFSIAWTRIYPDGVGEINQFGVNYYNRLIDSLLAKGIVPYVTLYHWDVPQALIFKYGGWQNEQIVNDFAVFAETCFDLFGDRVKHWITVNEPTVDLALNSGCVTTADYNCTESNKQQRRYIAGHNMLLAHATSVKIFREKYQASTGGIIGISLDIQWFEPLTNSEADIRAAATALAFRGGWFMDPLFHGDYPQEIKDEMNYALPVFTEEQKILVKGSADFIGVNYYTAEYISSKALLGFSNEPAFPVTYPSDVYVGKTKHGEAIGPEGASGLNIVPWGLEKLLVKLKELYGNPVFYITETGVSELRNPNNSLEENLNDEIRVQYLHDHFEYALNSVKRGVQLRGIFAWSLMDNFEWSWGYDYKFGLHYVDFDDGQKRYPKASALWLKQFLQ
ncbi:protein MpGH1.5 [Marchantia polymorpha subsp. ruderalis]|uniref:Beta-glucosidase n=2 Tax=Marchantia polymorpha TaxID=3197 RepID=A0A176WLH8_MARPO|nr:hypothetical protein AXG93_4142s1020 [Marchantia polymorpha subsp. ruderalis]PTQ27822.1 hypothetical protein MARPO_0182s0005 [Marchantia polymorpha]PTQ27823.1 hypothetical protein MARPO_0182s0005 [Marchantia polymorpha]BBN12109.1 hypothetical protein Mp_5g17440 [Marchantia polymorpha subsp. ruderalis]BBN12110.1 hypothetical protein Mp_5g17440 [Marchantia polymorpha subsp. ruderalis]|eukprot:PTQ27822.1 hypothetical protein MARPO_0182s0005 [Marchantia polymorpha]